MSEPGSSLLVRDLRIAFGSAEGTQEIVSGVNLEVAPGEVVGLVGETGVGKSLVLAAILGVLRPPARVVGGEVLLDGVDLLSLPEKQLQEIRGKKVGFIGSNPHGLLNPLLPVGKQVANVLRAHERVSSSVAKRRVLEMFESVGLPDSERAFHTYPHELSGGMAQRVVIAAGLISGPEVILADEPTSGLDVTIQAQTLELIKELVIAQSLAMLLVTKDLGIIANYCDIVSVMEGGQIVKNASVFDFFAADSSPVID